MPTRLCRRNIHAVKKYLAYRAEVEQRDTRTIANDRACLKRLLDWAGRTDFTNCRHLRPAFPQTMTQALNRHGEPMTSARIRKTINRARLFLEWARSNIYAFRKLNPTWINTIRPGRLPEMRVHRQVVSITTVRALIKVEDNQQLTLRRAKAAAALLFLSGIRATALATLPIKAVELSKGLLQQDPRLGVKTKLGKQATTALLDIPDLLRVARMWDRFVRGVLPEDQPWLSVYPKKLDRQAGVILSASSSPWQNASHQLRRDLHLLFKAADLPYQSPHAFRHGHAVYALKLSKDPADLKAISQNLMHSSLTVTDGIYACLSPNDVAKRIQRLGRK